MLSKRGFLQMSMAAASIMGVSGVGNWARLAAQDRFDQDALLEFEAFGNVTLMHVTDIRAQMVPAYYREPEVSIGLGDAAMDLPYLTGEDFRIRYGVGGATPMDYALTYEDFVTHAKAYGKTGGLDRVATVVNAIRTERPEALLLEGGDTLLGSLTSLRTQGQDMVDVMAGLKPDAMTFGGELVLGVQRISELVQGMSYAGVGQNISVGESHGLFDIIKPYEVFIRNGVKIAVIGQVYPFANLVLTGKKFTEIRYGLYLEHLQKMVDEVRSDGAALVICLSQNGFAIDRKMASVVTGIDVILSGRGHHALPEPVLVDKTHIITSGGHGKFVSRIDLDVQDSAVKDIRHKLIPIFADLIAPDPLVKTLVAAARSPFKGELNHVVGKADGLLFRRGTLTATWDSLICDALLTERDAEIALCSGHRWGGAILPEQDITREDIFSVTATPDPNTYRIEMTGEMLKALLERSANAQFSPDPFDRCGEEMLRVGGMRFRIDPSKPEGQRIMDMTLLATGTAIAPARSYMVAGWGAGSDGPPIWDVVEDYISKRGRVSMGGASTVALVTP